jgi:hypothetical protein
MRTPGESCAGLGWSKSCKYKSLSLVTAIFVFLGVGEILTDPSVIKSGEKGCANLFSVLTFKNHVSLCCKIFNTHILFESIDHTTQYLDL